MRYRQWGLMLFVAGSVGLLVGRAQPVPAAKDATEKEGQAAAKENAGESLEMRYARAQLQLAEANLRKVEKTNAKFAKTVSNAVISEYVEDLAIAKTQFDNSQRGHFDQYPTWISAAKSNWKSAEANYRNASSANQRQFGSVDPIDLERLRLRVEITKLQYERGMALVDASSEKKMQWQIAVLNDEVSRLKVQTSRITPQTRVYPWRY